MAVSQNGWPALTVAPSARLKWITGRVLPGDVEAVFTYLCEQFEKRVEAINPDHSWGWAYRDIRGASGLSNHASGTAIDLNAPKHPLGKAGTFSVSQMASIRAICKELDGVIRWGGDYMGRKDEMHFEVNATRAQVAAVAGKVRGSVTPASVPASAPTSGTYRRGSTGEPVRVLQAKLNRVFPSYSRLTVDGNYGPATEAVVKEFQTRAGLAVDGIVGAATAAELAKYGVKL